MSRHEARFDAAAEVPIEAPEVAAAIEAGSQAKGRERKDAIACFLSGSEGWREAQALLGGAFAEDGRKDD